MDKMDHHHWNGINQTSLRIGLQLTFNENLAETRGVIVGLLPTNFVELSYFGKICFR